MMVAAFALALAIVLGIMVSRDLQPGMTLDPITVQQGEFVEP